MLTAKEVIEQQIDRAEIALADLRQAFAGKSQQNLALFTEALQDLLVDLRASLACYADRPLSPDEVPIKPRDFLRRHPELTQGYSVAQPFLGEHLMAQAPNQPAQANPQQAGQAQTAGINPQQIQSLLQAVGQFAPLVFAFLQTMVSHLGGGAPGPAPGPAPQFGGAGASGDTLEHLARASASAIKAHSGQP